MMGNVTGFADDIHERRFRMNLKNVDAYQVSRPLVQQLWKCSHSNLTVSQEG